MDTLTILATSDVPETENGLASVALTILSVVCGELIVGDGALVSSVTDKEGEFALSLPAVSVLVQLMFSVPSTSVDAESEKLPSAKAVVVPIASRSL